MYLTSMFLFKHLSTKLLTSAYIYMNMRQIHIFFRISQAIRQFVSFFTCFVRIAKIVLAVLQISQIRKKQFHVCKPYKTPDA